MKAVEDGFFVLRPETSGRVRRMVAVTAMGVRTAIRNSHRQGFLRFVGLTMRARLSIPHISVDVKGQGAAPTPSRVFE
jgi:hypothetical protein